MNPSWKFRAEPDSPHRVESASPIVSRRQFLSRTGAGIGAVSAAALAAMGLLPGLEALAASAGNAYSPFAPKQPHFKPKAKRVLHLFAAGAPAQMDTWDPKPALKRIDNQQMPGDSNGIAFGSPFEFRQMGRSGIPVSEVFPQIGAHADKLAVIRSMTTDVPDHDIATLMMNTGDIRAVKPSVGSWVTYGLGSENQNMPGFIAMGPGGVQARNLRAAFLPGAFQGTAVDSQFTRIDRLIENIRNNYESAQEQRRQLDLLHQLNEAHSQSSKKDPQLEARLHAFELAYQMQMEATDAFDIRKESDATRQAYRADTQQGRQTLIARRLLERGVRFVQLWHGGWDNHANLATDLRNRAAEVDQPIAALLADLEQRGMLADTLVIWGGEFGRGPTADNNAMGRSPGRNHNAGAFSIWMAGGGVKGGTVYGETDEFGKRAIDNKVHIHDLHATILHLLGFDHEKLTFRHNGRDFRLTDVAGNVVRGVLA